MHFKLFSHYVPKLHFGSNCNKDSPQLCWHKSYPGVPSKKLPKLAMSLNTHTNSVNPLSTRPHQDVVWYNNSWLYFLKSWIMYQNKETNFLQKMSPHLSQLNGRNNLWILKLATYTKIEDHYSRCNWQHFRWIAKCSYFILSETQNIKFYWFVMNIKNFLLPIWWYNRGFSWE